METTRIDNATINPDIYKNNELLSEYLFCSVGSVTISFCE